MISEAGGRGISRFSRMEVPCMPWFSDRAGSVSTSRIALLTMLPSDLLNGVGTPNTLISRLNRPAYTSPCQRFAAPSRNANA